MKMEIRHVSLIMVAQLVRTQIPASSLHVRLVHFCCALQLRLVTGFVAYLLFATSNILTA